MHDVQIFSEHKLAIEYDENGHTDGDEKKKEIEIQLTIEKGLGCKLLELILMQKNYDSFVEIHKVQN